MSATRAVARARLPRGARVLLVLAAASLVASCSVVQTAYNNADTLLRWRATTYLDVHGAQAALLDRRIEDFLAWHRTSALPQYAAIAEDLARRVGAGLSRSDLDWAYDSMRAQLGESLRAAAERSAELLDGLSAEQITHLEQRLAEDNRRFREEFLKGSEQERRERRAKRNIERLEDFAGTLGSRQLDRVRAYSASAPLTDALRDRDRMRRQAELLDIVRKREARSRLAKWATGWQDGREPAYAAAAKTQLDAFFAMLLDIDRDMTAAQRERTVSRLRAYAADFEALQRSAGAVR